MVGDAERKIGDIDLLGEVERRRILEEWNQTGREIPQATLVDLFEEQVEKSPDAVAVAYEEQELTYRELNERANRLAHLLIGKGIGPEDVVALAMPRSPEMIVSLLGILKAGAAYLPIDPAYPAERIALMLEDAESACVITTCEEAPRLPECPRCLLIDQPGLTLALEQSPTNDPKDWERVRPLRPENPAYVIYTSGSTGRPKGVVIEHKAIVNRLKWMSAQYNIAPDDRILQKTPASFDVSVWEFFLSPIAGATLVVAPPDSHKDPSWLASIIREHRITTVHFVPSMLALFVADPAATSITLRRVFCSGEELTAQLRDRFHALARAELHNLYGPTEAAVDVTHWAAPPEDDSVLVPIGVPVWNTRMYVLDDWLHLVPPGVSGDLYISGAQLARGYLGQGVLTAERFVADPFGAPGTRMYWSGDLARWRVDGNLEFLGRRDRQVKIRGFRIELGEIEAALREEVGVAQAAVTVREDRPGEKRLVGYVVPIPGQSLDPRALRQHVAEKLPENIVPSAIMIVESMLLTPSGKLDRKALPTPEYVSEIGYRAPQSPQEDLLCLLFAEVLGLERVGIDDGFFDLGGHSLLTMRLVSRIRATLGVEIAIRTLFESPSVAELAKRLRGGGNARVAFRAMERPERLPMSYAQQRLWFMDRLEGASVEYNILGALRLKGDLDRKALESPVK